MIESYEKDLGIPVLHAWGMTETSPVGSVCRLKSTMADWPEQAQLTQRAKQGLPVPGLEMRVEGPDGDEKPWDGVSMGELVVRGPWVARSYYDNPDRSVFTADGWFRTGDVVTIDEHGYMEITDRIKDSINTRGEWISSVDMENHVAAHPGILEVAVVARPDPVRGEAPVVLIVRDPAYDEEIDPREIIALLSERFAHWQVPKSADIRFLESLPKTSVGKIDKKQLRTAIAESDD